MKTCTLLLPGLGRETLTLCGLDFVSGQVTDVTVTKAQEAAFAKLDPDLCYVSRGSRSFASTVKGEKARGNDVLRLVSDFASVGTRKDLEKALADFHDKNENAVAKGKQPAAAKKAKASK